MSKGNTFENDLLKLIFNGTAEDVTFSGPDDIKLVACIYLCG